MNPLHKTILIADDDKTIVDSITMVLESYNYEVLQVNNGTAVMQAIKGAPDLVLLDINMGGHNGCTVCKQIKRQAATRQIPVLMISGSSDIESAATECGADAYLAKPFGMEELMDKVNSLLQPA
ncbi:response regulator transcription factor [Mucilaginibacter sp.]